MEDVINKNFNSSCLSEIFSKVSGILVLYLGCVVIYLKLVVLGSEVIYWC